MDGGAWWAAVHGVTKSLTRLSDLPCVQGVHKLNFTRFSQISPESLESSLCKRM